MSAELLQIAPAAAGEDGAYLDDGTQWRLADLYERVPSVCCGCSRPGQCCELTKDEEVAGFATMYPLYLVEYLSIVDHVRRHFDPGRRGDLLGAFEERPVRCPFLVDKGVCSIYPVRPLSCRTYGILSPEEVEGAARDAQGNFPEAWIRSFLSSEWHTVCAEAQVMDQDLVAAHAEAMVSFAYERELLRMGRETGMPDGRRREVLNTSAKRTSVARWSWGGFNALMQSPADWLESRFEDYWKEAALAD